MQSLSKSFEDDVALLKDGSFQVLLLTSALPALGTALLSPVLESLTGAFGTSAANIGLIMSAYTAPAIVTVPVAGMISDRYGRKPVLVAGIGVFGVAGTMIAFTTDFRVVLSLRLLQGFGFAGITPIIITSIGDLYEGSKEVTAQGLRIAGTGVSQAALPLVAGVLIGIAWQFPFLLYAIAIPTAVLVYVLFDEPTNLDEPSTSSLFDRSSFEVRATNFLYLVKQRRVQAIVTARGLPTAGWIGFLTYNSLLVVNVLDGTPTQAGILASVGSLAFAFAATQAGRITDHSESRYRPILAANAGIVLGFAAVVFAPTVFVAAVGVFVAGCGLGTAGSIYISLTTGLAPVSYRGSIVSLSMGISSVVSTLTPVLIGIIIGIADPVFGFRRAIQFAGLSTALIAGGGGIVCLYISANALPVKAPTES